MKNDPWIKLMLAGLVLLALTSIASQAADEPVTRPKPGQPPQPPIGSQLTDGNGR